MILLQLLFKRFSLDVSFKKGKRDLTIVRIRIIMNPNSYCGGVR